MYIFETKYCVCLKIPQINYNVVKLSRGADIIIWISENRHSVP